MNKYLIWTIVGGAILFYGSIFWIATRNQASGAEQIIPVYSRETIDEITMDEFDLMCRCVMAEAGGEDYEVQNTVAEVILNRLDSELFPDTIREVIYQEKPKQFVVAWNGMLDDAEPTDSVCEAVTFALEERTNPLEVLYFTSEGYLKNTKPYRQIGMMYFSCQKE